MPSRHIAANIKEECPKNKTKPSHIYVKMFVDHLEYKGLEYIKYGEEIISLIILLAQVIVRPLKLVVNMRIFSLKDGTLRETN